MNDGTLVPLLLHPLTSNAFPIYKHYSFTEKHHPVPLTFAQISKHSVAVASVGEVFTLTIPMISGDHLCAHTMVMVVNVHSPFISFL